MRVTITTHIEVPHDPGFWYLADTMLANHVATGIVASIRDAVQFGASRDEARAKVLRWLQHPVSIECLSQPSKTFEQLDLQLNRIYGE